MATVTEVILIQAMGNLTVRTRKCIELGGDQYEHFCKCDMRILEIKYNYRKYLHYDIQQYSKWNTQTT